MRCMAVLESGMLAQGPKVAELEVHLPLTVEQSMLQAVNSGTAALHAALFAAGIGPGDEVITTRSVHRYHQSDSFRGGKTGIGSNRSRNYT